MSAADSRLRLGSVMVDAGLLTEAQLEHALAAQQASGRPLGEVVVSLGFASPGAVANALAEQHGGPLQTEYGLSVGLGRRSDVERRPGRPVGRDALVRRLAALEARVAAADDVVRERDSLAAYVSRLEAELSAPDDEPVPAGSHLLLAPVPGGYGIVEADGPCPTPGAEVVDAEGRIYRVARVRRSPLGDGRRCAHLEPA